MGELLGEPEDAPAERKAPDGPEDARKASAGPKADPAPETRPSAKRRGLGAIVAGVLTGLSIVLIGGGLFVVYGPRRTAA